MEQLIAALEAAPEGSKDLDKKINAILSPDSDKPWLGPGYWYDDSQQPGTGDRWERYTTSLDAALTLVPEGCGWKVQQNLNGNCWAVIQRLRIPEAIESDFDIWAESNNCSTPALALCITALKARQAMEQAA